MTNFKNDLWNLKVKLSLQGFSSTHIKKLIKGDNLEIKFKLKQFSSQVQLSMLCNVMNKS